jgi:hypothetical protein
MLVSHIDDARAGSKPIQWGFRPSKWFAEGSEGMLIAEKQIKAMLTLSDIAKSLDWGYLQEVVDKIGRDQKMVKLGDMFQALQF